MSVSYASVILYFSVLLNASDTAKPRIIGGLPATIEDFPFQAIVLVRMTSRISSLCGGAIFKDNVVITAAHCVNNAFADNVTVNAGSVDRHFFKSKEYAVQSVIIHERYDIRLSYDIALLILQKPLELSPYVQPVPLSSLKESQLVGKQATVSGWGKTQNGLTTAELRYTHVTVVSKSECRKIYSRMMPKNVLCAGSQDGRQDACFGDSGGPLVYNNELIGIVSCGLGCGRPKIPALYVKISSLRDWINEHSLAGATTTVTPEPDYDFYKILF